MKTRKLILTGRVQGVGCRFFVYQLATKFDINGEVKNIDNGCVEVLLKGDENNLNKISQKIKKGNFFIKVSEMKVEELDLEPFSDFKITY